MSTIEDFLPYYPDLRDSSLSHLKELRPLTRIEDFPEVRGQAMQHQQNIARILSSRTPYDRVLLVHEMGTGKGCSTVQAIEQIKLENSSIKGAIIFARGRSLLTNFINELVFKCTTGEYIPDEFDQLTDLEKVRRIDKSTRGWYSLNTFEKFAKTIKNLSDENIKKIYSNKILVVDEIHNLRSAESDDTSLNIYDEFHRFFHVVDNCKIIGLSGTPMKDTPEEIAGVMNLLLPLDQQFNARTFKKDYLFEELDGSFAVQPGKVAELKQIFHQYVSFLKAMRSDVQIDFQGEQQLGDLRFMTVYPVRMRRHQQIGYRDAYKLDHAMGGGDRGQGVSLNSRQASLFVFPDGSTGKEGFLKYVRVQKSSMQGSKRLGYRMSPELRKFLHVNGTTTKDILGQLRKMSGIYAHVIEQLLAHPKRKAFVYGWFVEGSGIILFSLLLQLFGFSSATGGSRSVDRRYAVVSNKTSTDSEIRDLIAMFNRPQNKFGDVCQVIIGSSVISEGFSLLNIQDIHITTGHWNYTDTSQAIARGIRLGSHQNLIDVGVTPNVRIFQYAAIGSKLERSINLRMYKLAEIKDLGIQRIIRLMKESAFDCELNYERNRPGPHDQTGQRECEYDQCDYKCDFTDSVPADESNYNLYYIRPIENLLRRKITGYLRDHRQVTLQQLFDHFELSEYIDENGERLTYTEFEIRTAIQELVDDSDPETQIIRYDRFVQLYVRSTAQQLMSHLEQEFRTTFSLSFESIQAQFSDWSTLELLSALRLMINQNVTIYNRYGFRSYLREDKDVYFLVSHLGAPNKFTAQYYTTHPIVHQRRSFPEIITRTIQRQVPSLITQLFDQSTPIQQWSHILQTIPLDIQSMLLENSLTAARLGRPTNQMIRARLLDFFEPFIKPLGSRRVSTLLLRDKNSLRCEDLTANQWRECSTAEWNEFENAQQNRRQNLENNPYRIYGLYNPNVEGGAFCLRDLRNVKKTSDGRKIKSGQRCSSWKKPALWDIILSVFDIPAPDDFAADLTIDQVRRALRKKNPAWQNYVDDNSPLDRWRQVYFWVKKTIKQICGPLREWMESQNLVVIDTNCGIQQKRNKKGLKRSQLKKLKESSKRRNKK